MGGGRGGRGDRWRCGRQGNTNGTRLPTTGCIDLHHILYLNCAEVVTFSFCIGRSNVLPG